MAFDEHDLEQIDGFLEMVGRSSLLEYYDIALYSPKADVEERIRTIRTWAQAQQANPKHKGPALWLIRNNALIRKVLIDDLEAYLEAHTAHRRRQKLDQLALFVRGSLVRGALTQKAEAAIFAQSVELGLEHADVERYLREEMGLDSGPPGPAPAPSIEESLPDSSFIDVYQVLQVSPEASQEELEAAYRARYRWARSLKDVQRASEVYQFLDAVWGEISDPARRQAYDANRFRVFEDATPAPPEIRISDQRLFSDEQTVETPPFEPGIVERRRSARRPSSATGPVREDALDDLFAMSEGMAGFEPYEGDATEETSPGEQPPPDGADRRDRASGGTRARATPRTMPGPSRITRPTGAVVSEIPVPPILELSSNAPHTQPEAHRSRVPRLKIKAPAVIVFFSELLTMRRKVALEKIGDGSLWVQIHSNQPWLSVQPTELQGTFTRATLSLSLDVPSVPKNGVAALTIRPQYGERQVLSVCVRPIPTWLWLAVVACALLVAILVALAWTHVASATPPPSLP
jgi:hypothetical protein